MGANKRMSFGFGLFPFDRYRSIGEMVEVARRGDRLGFDALLLPEHLLPPEWPNAEMATKLWLDIPTVAAHLAAVTSRVKFLSGVIVVPYHHPVALAKALATLDVLSNGRVLFGAGAGWMKAEFRRLGLPYEERGAMTDEYLRAMKELWTSDSPRFGGKYISFDDVSFYPKPVQKPHIPILIGGTGPRPFQRVAELGDGWFAMTATFDTIRSGLADIRERMERVGRDSTDLWVGYTGFGMGEDRQVQGMRHDAGDNVVGEGPARNAEEAIERIERYRRAGVTFLSIGFPWRTAGELMEQMERFAADVMPAFG
jgi:probable F420-dependent oxidoreductase